MSDGGWWVYVKAKRCWCHACKKLSRREWPPLFVVCPTCGNKRCPRATDHLNACTGSNEPDQPGSIYGGLSKDEGGEG